MPCLTSFQGKIDAAKVILRHGGLYDPVEAELKQKEEEQKVKASDDYYHGLNVGGKKVNWALELQPKAQKPKIPRVSAIHYAAYFNQPASIEFLLKYVLCYFTRRSLNLPFSLQGG